MVIKKTDEWHVYLLSCGDGSYYCGTAKDVERRLKQHNEGKGAKYTRSRLPVKVIAVSQPMSRGEALSVEARVKKQPRGEKADMVSSATG